MNALFITTADLNDGTYGGAKASARNYQLISEYFDVDVYTVKKRSSLKSALSVVRGYFPPTSESDLKAVEEMYISKEYPLVFLDNSNLGEYIHLFDKSKSRIVTFYLNCEHDYISVRFGQKKSIKKMLYQRACDISERKATMNSDVRIGLSERDAKRVAEVYGREFDFLLPLTLSDLYRKVLSEDEKKCLLFGPVARANIEAYSWFVKNVSPFLPCKTLVAGKGFEAYKMWENDKVQVRGYVEDIAELYAEACCVAIPLFSGGGMKIKLAEALMFGKVVFGTDEAFSGYDVVYNEVGGLCNTADEFIEMITQCVNAGDNIFSQNNRDIYLKKYSIESSREAFGNIIEALELQV